MSGFEIKAARREMARARIALCGPSGSGKTYSALLMARGMAEALVAAGKIPSLAGAIGVVDTERKSASLYSDLVPFDVIEMEPPYSPERYCQAIERLEKHGCAILILDQISHAWAGQGGLLEYVDVLKSQSRNAFSPWQKATPEQNRFVDRMLRSDAHIIATMRAKSEYVLEDQIINGQKKSVPRKIGLAPVQRDGIEYEFTTMLDLDVAGNTATASKDRTRLFTGQVNKLTTESGQKLADWLLSGAPVAPSAPRGNGGGEPLLELEAELALVGEALDERAATVAADHDLPLDGVRAALKSVVLREVGVGKGTKPSLAQAKAMLALAVDAELDEAEVIALKQRQIRDLAEERRTTR